MMIRFALQVFGITNHHRPGFFHHRNIAIPFIHQPGQNYRCASPLGRIAKSVAKGHIFRRDIRNQTIFELSFHHIIHLLAVQLIQIEVEMNRAAHQVSLFEPTQFFAVRAIGYHTLQVTFNAPVDQVESAVEQIIRTRKRSGRRC